MHYDEKRRNDFRICLKCGRDYTVWEITWVHGGKFAKCTCLHCNVVTHWSGTKSRPDDMISLIAVESKI